MKILHFGTCFSLFLFACGANAEMDSFSVSTFPLENSAEKPPVSLIGEPTRVDGCSLAAPSLETLATDNSGFRPQNAYAALWFSQTIELPEAVIWERLNQVPLEDARLLKRAKMGIQAGVFRVDGRVLVVFRGTKDVIDYYNNALIAPVSGEPAGLPGKVHMGFRKSFLALWNQVYDAAIELGAEELGVWVMGHSLGGALSQFAAYNFLQRSIDVKGVLGSGVPLPGDSEYQGKYNAVLGNKTFLVAFENDITPNVPPQPEVADAFAAVLDEPLRVPLANLAQRFDYRQAGKWFRLTRSGELLPIPSLVDFQREYYAKMLQNSLNVGLPRLLFTNPIYVKDHAVEYYRCAMREYVSRLQ
jgi:pimeloyl-ACP methyl ester carboxylesterase